MGNSVEAISSVSAPGSSVAAALQEELDNRTHQPAAAEAPESKASVSVFLHGTSETSVPVVEIPADVVTLSETSQARRLEGRGESVAQIATSLGTDVKTVDLYLGIPDAASAEGANTALSATAKAS